MIHRCSDRCRHGDHYHPSTGGYDSSWQDSYLYQLTSAQPKLADPSNYQVKKIHNYELYQVENQEFMARSKANEFSRRSLNPDIMQ